MARWRPSVRPGGNKQMPVNSEALSHYLELLRAGDSENAFFGLLELGEEAVPLLIAEAVKPANHAIRAKLVEVIWQSRSPNAIHFLGESLGDPDPAVWKQALDGLVAIRGPEA